MASPVDASPWALTVVAKAARKVKGLCRDVLRRCRVADEERAEPETALTTMQSTGVRNRRANDQAPASTDDHEEISPESDQSPATSPTTTATSGTFTPGTSEGIPETSDSFIKVIKQHLSDRFGASWSFGMSAEELERLNHERGYDKFKQETLEEYPEGFPKLAAFISCDDSLAMHRAFKYCHNRVLLHLEVEIMEIQKQLHNLDKEDAADPDREHRLRWTEHDEGWDAAQVKLITTLKSKLKEYDDFMKSHVFLQGLDKPPSRNYRSYFNWHWTNKPLAPGYYDYVYYNSDFVSTSGIRPNYCEELVRDHIDKWHWSPLRKILKASEKMKKPTSEKQFTFFSQEAESGLSRFLLVSSIMLILMTPVFLLFLLPMSHLLMAVTTAGFIFLFALIMCIVTNGKVYEVFVGTATYGAVLIMFLGNISQTAPGT